MKEVDGPTFYKCIYFSTDDVGDEFHYLLVSGLFAEINYKYISESKQTRFKKTLFSKTIQYTNVR